MPGKKLRAVETAQPSLINYLFYALMESGTFANHVWLEARGADPKDALINLAAGYYQAERAGDAVAEVSRQIGRESIVELLPGFQIEPQGTDGVTITVYRYIVKTPSFVFERDDATEGIWRAAHVPEYSIVRLADGRIGIITNVKRKNPLVLLDSDNRLGVRIKATDEVEVLLFAAAVAQQCLAQLAVQRPPARETRRRIYVERERLGDIEGHAGHDGVTCAVYGGDENAAVECEPCGTVLIDFDNEGDEADDYARLVEHAGHALEVLSRATPRRERTVVRCSDCCRDVLVFEAEGEEVYTVEAA